MAGNCGIPLGPHSRQVEHGLRCSLDGALLPRPLGHSQVALSIIPPARTAERRVRALVDGESGTPMAAGKRPPGLRGVRLETAAKAYGACTAAQIGHIGGPCGSLCNNHMLTPPLCQHPESGGPSKYLTMQSPRPRVHVRNGAAAIMARFELAPDRSWQAAGASADASTGAGRVRQQRRHEAVETCDMRTRRLSVVFAQVCAVVCTISRAPWSSA